MAIASTLLPTEGAVAAPRSCAAEQGDRRAADYLRQCRDVASPGERLLCDAAKPCAAVIEEIARGCEALGPDGPDFCGLYAPDGDADADPDTVE